MSSGASVGGSGGECEGEEQEDPSSSSYLEHEASEAVANLSLNNQGHNGPDEDELSTFRQQWQRELEASPQQTPKKENKESEHGDINEDSFNGNQQKDLSDYEKARTYFVLATELESAGCWYESIQNYKRAMAINPNIELLLYQEGILDVEEATPEEETTPERVDNEADDDDEEEMVEGEDLLTRIQRIQGRKGVLCEPAANIQGTHISWLPYEVILLITRWVVSSELDSVSLERLGATCRGLYLVARDQDIWRNICIRTWGIECGTPRAHGFPSWRQMYIDRPRLHLNGCYISKTNYLRHGETGFQDQYYRPWFLVQYYRYLRFFPEGVVMMLTTPDEPGASVGLLKSRNTKPGQGVLCGHYRLRGDRVVIVMKKTAEKKSTQQANSRFRSRRREPDPPEREQTFHIELQLSAAGGRRNMRLAWKGYSVCSRRDQWTEFELCPGKFPAFSFSRVRRYTREAAAPLAAVSAAALPAAHN